MTVALLTALETCIEKADLKVLFANINWQHSGMDSMPAPLIMSWHVQHNL